MARVRVGVFVCHCGSNIGGVVRVPEVVEYARELPLVSCADDNLYTCSDAGLTSIKEQIRERGLNRVVVASCTPRTHEELFRRACEEAGLNRYLFEFVNLREHCSWIHVHEPDHATAKAKELVRLGVAKASRLAPLEMERTPVEPSCLVIGAGPAGLSAAGSLAAQGFEVHLVEREARLGGIAAGLWKLLPGDRDAAELVRALVEQIDGRDNVHVHLEAEVEHVSGFVGAFEARLAGPDGPREIRVGTVIVATGARELEPLGLYRLAELEGVTTQAGLEARLVRGERPAGDVVMINCAGARGPDRAYCGRLCCAVSIKNARLLRELDPSTRVTVLQRDMMAMGTAFETEYRNAKRAGVRFVRYDPASPPEVIGDGAVEAVRVINTLSGEQRELPAATVVLTPPLVGQPEAPELSQLLKVPLDADGFFLEAHVKLRPVEFATDGVYVAGAARFPSNIRESVSQGKAAAAKAAAPMAAGEVAVEATTAATDAALCSACGNCERTCPYGAVAIEADPRGRPASVVNPVICKGCGACVPACPCGAIQQLGFTDSQIFAMVESLALDREQEAAG
jgi:heterodisulfide reductase subunit A